MDQEKSRIAFLLKGKNIVPGDCFQYGGEKFYLSKSLRIIDIMDQEANLTENDFWEHWDSVFRISRQAFETQRFSYRENLRKEKGLPIKDELKKLALKLSEQYQQKEDEKFWKALSFYDEETLRYMIAYTADFLAKDNNRDLLKKRQVERELNRRAAWEKFNHFMK